MERHNKLNLCHKHAVTVQPHLTFGGQEDGSNGGGEQESQRTWAGESGSGPQKGERELTRSTSSRRWVRKEKGKDTEMEK